MKIDFTARYKEVAGLLQASTKPATGQVAQAFEQSLGGLLLQQTEITDQKPHKSEAYVPKQSLRDPMDDIRASFKFDPPEQQLVPLTPIIPGGEVSATGTPTVPAVKTPTVFEVKRVDLPSSPPNVIGIPQLDKQAIRNRLVSAAAKMGLDPALTQSVVSAESSFNPQAVSKDGHASKGLFQLLDSTGRHLMSRLEDGPKEYDPFDPEMNINLGTSYLKYLQDIFSSNTSLPNNLSTKAAADAGSLEKFVVAAFNAGEGRVASAQGRSAKAGKDPAHYDHVAPFLPSTTREYVTKVVSGKKLF